MLALIGTLTLPIAAQADNTLYQAIDDACNKSESALNEALDQQAWKRPAACEPGSNFDVDLCRDSYAKMIRDETRQKIADQSKSIRQTFWSALAAQPADQVNPMHQAIGQVMDQLSQEFPREDVIEKQLKDLQSADLQKDPPDLSPIAKAAVAGFGQACRTRAVAALAAEGTTLSRLAQDDGSAYLASLRKETGFSQVVRCVWQTGTKHHRLDCAPGLRVTGHDVAVIQILPPADEKFRLRWVQAIGAEELPGASNREEDPYRKRLHCPGYEGKGPMNLACDELCFSSEGPCDSGTFRPLKTQSAEVAVHSQRWLNTTYGCAVHRKECAQKRLRGGSTNTHAAKLTLLTKGRSPVIRVRAMDEKGNLAEGEVLVGYQRWRVETGGFMGFSGLVDDEVVTQADEDDSTKVKIVKIRKSDSYAQETGIFVNFIPSNYEAFGVSLGFATADGSAPSVYVGPTIRLRTFGNRGLASLSFGAVMRQVDRFPDLRHLRAIHPPDQGVYTLPADSRFLEADRQLEVDSYVAFQLGFSFGPISVPDSEN